MDVLELSRKLEENLLEGKMNALYFKKTISNTYNFRPRVAQTKVPASENEDTIRNNISSKDPGENRKKALNVKNIYLNKKENKKEKVMHKNLETIYEHPILRKGNIMFIGTSKVKRSIYFDKEFRKVTKQKSKLRKIKMKKLGKKFESFKMTDDEFKSKMLRIENFINDIDSDYDSCKNHEIDIQIEENKCEVENMKMEVTTIKECDDFDDNQDKNIPSNGKLLEFYI